MDTGAECPGIFAVQRLVPLGLTFGTNLIDKTGLVEMIFSNLHQFSCFSNQQFNITV